MKVKTLGPIVLGTSQETDAIVIDGSGPLSVQPVLFNNIGSSTYTIQVSNDKENYTDYNSMSTDVSVEDSVQIHYSQIPWKYMRMSVSSKDGDSGQLTFVVSHSG